MTDPTPQPREESRPPISFEKYLDSLKKPDGSHRLDSATRMGLISAISKAGDDFHKWEEKQKSLPPEQKEKLSKEQLYEKLKGFARNAVDKEGLFLDKAGTKELVKTFAEDLIARSAKLDKDPNHPGEHLEQFLRKTGNAVNKEGRITYDEVIRLASIAEGKDAEGKGKSLTERSKAKLELANHQQDFSDMAREVHQAGIESIDPDMKRPLDKEFVRTLEEEKLKKDQNKYRGDKITSPDKSDNPFMKFLEFLMALLSKIFGFGQEQGEGQGTSSTPAPGQGAQTGQPAGTQSGQPGTPTGTTPGAAGPAAPSNAELDPEIQALAKTAADGIADNALAAQGHIDLRKSGDRDKLQAVAFDAAKAVLADPKNQALVADMGSNDETKAKDARRELGKQIADKMWADQRVDDVLKKNVPPAVRRESGLPEFMQGAIPQSTIQGYIDQAKVQSRDAVIATITDKAGAEGRAISQTIQQQAKAAAQAVPAPANAPSATAPQSPVPATPSGTQPRTPQAEQAAAPAAKPVPEALQGVHPSVLDKALRAVGTALMGPLGTPAAGFIAAKALSHHGAKKEPPVVPEKNPFELANRAANKPSGSKSI